MSLQMVDPHKRNISSQRQPLGKLQANEQSAQQAGAAGGRDAIDVLQAAGGSKRLRAETRKAQQMLPGGDLGDNATKLRVEHRLGVDQVAFNLQAGAGATHHAYCRLIAARLYAQYAHAGGYTRKRARAQPVAR